MTERHTNRYEMVERERERAPEIHTRRDRKIKSDLELLGQGGGKDRKERSKKRKGKGGKVKERKKVLVV